MNEDSYEVSNEPNAVLTEDTVGTSASTAPTRIASNQMPHECKFNASSRYKPISNAYFLVGSLTGDVFKLTIDDIKEVSQSDQVGSEIFLTMPHILKTAPFVTVPVSNRLALNFASRRGHPSLGHP